MATKTPVTGSTCSVPSLVLLIRRPVTLSGPRTSATSLSHRNVILGLANARSCMIFEARSVSRRWTTVTDLPNLVRNMASSMAESPPPMTAMSWPRKKNPSQVAHQETPCPPSSFSPGTPSSLYREPVAMITALAR